MSKNKSSQSVSTPHYNTEFDPKTGKDIEVAPNISRICAPNIGPYTFTGTNTYLVGDDELFVIDPGPKDNIHLKSILAGINGRKVAAIVLTHTHKDHSPLAKCLQKKTDAPIWFGGKHRLSRPKFKGEVNLLHSACEWRLNPDRALKDGETITAGTVKLEVIATPGHCANHLCFGVQNTPFLFSGDHVMGWNSTLIATPDGSMKDYFNSLDRLLNRDWEIYLPGHGAPIAENSATGNGLQFTAALRKHRRERNEQILECVKNGATSINKIVNQIYPGVGMKIRIAAAMTVQAHVEYLGEQGRLVLSRGVLGKIELSVTS